MINGSFVWSTWVRVMSTCGHGYSYAWVVNEGLGGVQQDLKLWPVGLDSWSTMVIVVAVINVLKNTRNVMFELYLAFLIFSFNIFFFLSILNWTSFDLKIEKTAKANRKIVWERRQREKQLIVEDEDIGEFFIFEATTGPPPLQLSCEQTLEKYGNLNRNHARLTIHN